MSAGKVDTAKILVEFDFVAKKPSKLSEPSASYDPAEIPSQAPHFNQLQELDLSQIEHNLSLTPEERLIEHQHALELTLELEAAGRKLRDKSQ